LLACLLAPDPVADIGNFKRNFYNYGCQWPCVTDNGGITTFGLTALGREMSTPPTLQLSMAHFAFLVCQSIEFKTA